MNQYRNVDHEFEFTLDYGVPCRWSIGGNIERYKRNSISVVVTGHYKSQDDWDFEIDKIETEDIGTGMIDITDFVTSNDDWIYVIECEALDQRFTVLKDSFTE